MPKKFEILEGSHHVGESVFRKGQFITSDDDLAAIHGKAKFRFVEDVVPSTPAPVEPESSVKSTKKA